MSLNIGVIGFGGMAHWHATHAAALEGVRFVCAADIDPARLEKAGELGLEACAGTRELLARGDINLVLIATPNQVHRELAVAALRAGKHVLVEKPAALSVAEWDEMTAAADQCGRILTVHQNRRFDSDYRTVRKCVEEGLLGRVFAVESRVYGCMGPMYGWRGVRAFGGGMVLDWGVHLFDQVLEMFPGRVVTDVRAEAGSFMGQEVEDTFKVLLRLDEGPLLQVEAGSYSFRPLPRWYVSGDGGTLTMDSFDVATGGITAPAGKPELAAEVVMTPAGPTRMMAPQLPKTRREVPLAVWEGEDLPIYRNLLEAVEGRAEPLVMHAQTRRVLRLLEIIRDAAESGHSVPCEL